MIKGKIKQLLFNKKWRRLNRHNYTTAKNKFDDSLVSVGKKTYGALTVYTYNHINKLSIGNYCSIGPYVQFVLSADHEVNHLSTYPFKAKYGLVDMEGSSKGDIIVEDDVWFGTNSVILSGVHIGRGAVIAAGAVVNKDVPPYAIVGGVPAHVLKYRFSTEIIDALMKLDYEKLNDTDILNNIDVLYKQVDENTVDEVIGVF